MAGTGRKAWAADEILAAADLQSYIQDQVVFVYASSSARASGILTPTEGMISYLKDTNALEMFDGSNWVNVLPNTGTAGTYTKVTTDVKGRVTSGTTLSASDIPILDIGSKTSGTLSVGRGGTGATSAAVARANLDAPSQTEMNQAKVDINNLEAVVNGYNTSFTTDTLNTQVVNIKNSGGTNTAQIVGSSGAASFKNTVINGTFNVTSSAAFGSTMYGGAVYNQTNTGRAMYIASDGLFGIGASSIRFKENVVDAELDIEAVKKIAVRYFNYKEDFSNDQTRQLGVIAEELVELGLTDFVYFDEQGVPDGVAYDKLALAVLLLVQNQADRLDSLEARLAKLEK